MSRTIFNGQWVKNAAGGFKVQLPAVKRIRHEGVRCYGSHLGKKCWPYDFSREPKVRQSTLMVRPDGCTCPSGEYSRGRHDNSCKIFWKVGS